MALICHTDNKNELIFNIAAYIVVNLGIGEWNSIPCEALY